MATVPKTMQARGHATAPHHSVANKGAPTLLNDLTNRFRMRTSLTKGIQEGTGRRYVDIDESELWASAPLKYNK